MILFALSLADGVADLDRPMQPLESLPDLFRSRERLPRGGMRSDEASEIDHHRPDVGRLPVGHPRDVPVTLRLQQRVEQVDVLVGKRLGRRGLGALPREDGQVGDVDGGDGVEGEALAQVVGAVQPAVLDPGPGLQRPEPGLESIE